MGTMMLLDFFFESFSHLLFSLGFFLFLVYTYLTWNFDFWRKQGIAGEKPWPLIGTLKPIWIQDFHEQDLAALHKFGHLHGGFEGSNPVLFVSNPEILKKILVKDFAIFPHRRSFCPAYKDKITENLISSMKGEKWRCVRSTLSPSYTTSKLKQMIPLLDQCMNNSLEAIRLNSDEETIMECTSQFNILTLDTIASCTLGMKIDCTTNPNSDIVLATKRAYRRNAKRFYILTILKWFPKLLPNPFYCFRNTAKRAIEMRIQNKNFSHPFKDILQLMLEAESPDDFHLDGSLRNTSITRAITEAQVLSLILAGHETANTLSFLVYELAQNQNIQDKLIEEIDENLKLCKGKLTYDIIINMQYLDMVISETLRKYPPSTRTTRTCTQDGYNLNGTTLRNGIVIIIPIFAIHHNPEFYANPDQFDPDRFSPEHKMKRNPLTYIPFGAGPRNCIAKRFALLNIKLATIRFLANYHIHPCKETEMKIVRGMRLLQPNSLKLKFLKRRAEHQ